MVKASGGTEILVKPYTELTHKEQIALYKKYQSKAFEKNQYEIINGEIYTIPEKGLVQGGLDNKKGIKTPTKGASVGQEISSFATLVDKIISLDQETLNELGLTKEEVSLYFDKNKPISVGSTRRSLKENIGAYGKDLKKLTNSKHSTGEAMDIWARQAPQPTQETKNAWNKIKNLSPKEQATAIKELDESLQNKIPFAKIAEEVDKDGDGYYDEDLPALKLEAFLNTEKGKKFLKKAGLTVYVHQTPGSGGKGRHLHIDNENRWNYSPSGLVYEKDLFTPYKIK